MRQVSIILLALFVLFSCAQAEPRVPGVTGFGAKLGFGLATLSASVDAFEDQESFGGGTFGAFVTYGFTPAISLQPELLLAVKGSGAASAFFGRGWRHNYLEIPVLVKYNLSPTGTLRPSLFAGPAVALLLSSEFQPAFGHAIDITEAMKSTDFGFVVGGALEYGHFALDVRYDLGLANVYNPDVWNQLMDAEDPANTYHMTDDDTVKNRVLSFALCYRY